MNRYKSKSQIAPDSCVRRFPSPCLLCRTSLSHLPRLDPREFPGPMSWDPKFWNWWETLGAASETCLSTCCHHVASSGNAVSSVQLFSRVRLCDPMDCSRPGLPVHRQLPEFTQTHVHQVGDASQPSHPLLSPSPPVFNLSQRQGFSNESVLEIQE